MKILVSGSSGFLGTELCVRLQAGGNAVGRLVRGTPVPAKTLPASNPAGPPWPNLPSADLPWNVLWNPGLRLDAASLSGADAVVHLAGRNVGTRWTEQVKSEIRESRLAGTATIARAAAESFRASGKPRVLVSASGAGYYGDRGDEILTESSSSGSGFLAEVCRDWEMAAMEAAAAGVRVVLLRLALVLSERGGALQAMLPLFRHGLGGRVGNGRQYWSWITLPDAVSAIELALANQTIAGPVNLSSPNPVSNAEFTRALGRSLHRPAILPAPAFALRLVLGGMAEETLLASQRVQPAKLLASGFQFAHPELRPALYEMLAG